MHRDRHQPRNVMSTRAFQSFPCRQVLNGPTVQRSNVGHDSSRLGDCHLAAKSISLGIAINAVFVLPCLALPCLALPCLALPLVEKAETSSRSAVHPPISDHPEGPASKCLAAMPWHRTIDAQLPCALHVTPDLLSAFLLLRSISISFRQVRAQGWCPLPSKERKQSR